MGPKKEKEKPKKNPEKYHIIHSSVKSFLNLKKRKSFFIQGCVSFTKKVTLRNFRDNEKKRKKKKGCSIKNSGEKIGSDNV